MKTKLAVFAAFVGALFTGIVQASDVAAPDRLKILKAADVKVVPIQEEIVKKEVKKDYTLVEFYLNGEPFNGEPTRIHGFYARPSGDGKFPAVVQLHGAGLQVLKPDAAVYYATNGFCCVSIDWWGPRRFDKKPRKPPYSEFKEFGNMARPQPEGSKHRFKLVGVEKDGIVNGNRFIQRAFHYLRAKPEVRTDALFLSGMSAGAHQSLLTLGIVGDIRGAAVKYGTAYIRDLSWFGGYFGPLSLCAKEEQDRWLSVLDPKHGLSDYKASVLLLSGTDDIFFHMPHVLKTYREIPTEKRLLMLPNDNHTQVGNEVIPLRYFRSLLKTAPIYPDAAAPTAEIAGGTVRLRASFTAPSPVETVAFYVKRMPRKGFRFGKSEGVKWEKVAAAVSNGVATAEIPAPAADEQIVAYLLVEDTTRAKITSDTVEIPAWPKWRGLPEARTAQVHSAPVVIARKINTYDRAEVTDPGDLAYVKAFNSLRGNISTNKEYTVHGWFEYDFDIPTSGWYVLNMPDHGWGNEFIWDGKVSTCASFGKIGNYWLDKGRHTLRLQRYLWTGFGAITKLVLRRARDVPAETLRLTTKNKYRRVGEKLRLTLESGGNKKEYALGVRLLKQKTNEVVAETRLTVPAREGHFAQDVEVACPQEGTFDVRLVVDGREVDARDVAVHSVVVVDTEPPVRGGELKKTLVMEIDCAATAPPYAGVGGAMLVKSPLGDYRESGSNGFLRAQHQGRDCGWFAYPLKVPEPQVPYLLEVDYPDDAFRTYCIAVREAVPGAYHIAGGVDSGECFSLTRKMQTHTILFWPLSTDLRVLLVTAHNGRRGAAASKIRLYRVEGSLPLPERTGSKGRRFANWYEEGTNFMAMYGAKGQSPIVGAERWARTIAAIHGSTLVSTVSVYQMAMYPSKYNREFCWNGTPDWVRILLMKCEKYDLGFIGEFHPEARELRLAAQPEKDGDPLPNCLVSKDGKWGSIPRYAPLHPANRAWYLGMIREFAERYADSPAFRGVSLRIMEWVNPALNNFHSLAWGYDDDTIGAFERETSIKIPVEKDDPGRFKARYDWIMSHAKEKWIEWRCEKITEIHRDIRDALRAVRPDLTLYVSNNGEGFGREGGIDREALGKLEGVAVVNGAPYGRRSYTYRGPLWDAKLRDSMLKPEFYDACKMADGSTSFLYGAGYFEATERVVPNALLGFPEAKKRTWMSGVVNPSGRHSLERYALSLAQADAQYLADGGNAYTLGQPVLAEFMKVYRALPAVPFQARADARDPVAVWEHSTPKRFCFYAVNRERYPVTVTISMQGLEDLYNLATREKVGCADGTFRVTLKPYELMAWTSNPETRITSVAEVVPAAEKAKVAGMIDWVKNLDRELAKKLSPGELETLRIAAEEAADAFAKGAYWRARTRLEYSVLVAIYQKLKVYPPGLYDFE